MRTLVLPILFCSLASLGSSQPEERFELDPIVASANRILADGANLDNAVYALSQADLFSGRYRDLSDALSSTSNLASYRRTQSASAHPTTQGVRLRNLGASATSRVLVLYNGVPQNDPFGGWVYWHQYDISQLESVSVHPGGVGEIWGNMASGGLLSLIAKKPSPGSASIQAVLGSSNRSELRANAAYAVSPNTAIDVGIRQFRTDGFHTLRQDQRGSVDEKAGSEATSLQARVAWSNSPDWKSQLSLRGFAEDRGNGTPLAQNSTDSLDLAYIAERQIPAQDARLNLNLYLQDRDFKNVFTSVSEDRNSEIPALDQYKVPVRSTGGALVYRRESEGASNYSAGFDFRLVEGSVNEAFRNLGNGFTRDRQAGGEQEFYGVFVKTDWQAAPADRISATARIEEIKQRNGTRRETNSESQAILLDESYANRSDRLLSGNINWSHQFSDTRSGNLSVFSGYRAPTLNELYRPFRVRNDITEANPNLDNERHQGVELSLRQASSERASARFSAFYYQADDMIANALVTTQPGFDPRFGFIPAGGSGSSRVNLDESTVSGFELQLDRSLTKTLHASLDLTYAKTRIDRDELTELVGNAFPQSSPWKAVLGLDWDPTENMSLWSRYRWSDRSYEGLSNSQPIASTADLAIGAAYQINASASISLVLSNVLDEDNVTGISSNDLRTIDEPREIQLSLTWRR